MSGRDRKIEKCGHSEDLKYQREAEFLESGVSGKPRGRSPGVRGGVSDPKARSVAPNGVRGSGSCETRRCLRRLRVLSGKNSPPLRGR